MTGGRGALRRAALLLAATALGPVALVGPGVTSAARATPPVGADEASAGLTGTHRLVVLPLWWQSGPDATTAELTAATASAAAFWEQQSGGVLDLVPSVRPWVRITATAAAGCDPAALAAAAAAADPAGAATSATRHVVIHVPASAACRSNAGDAATPAVLVGRPAAGSLEHAAGHALGLADADGLQCVDGSGWQSSLSATCGVVPGGDRVDVMGAGPRRSPPAALGPAQADRSGWLAAVDVHPSELASPRIVQVHAAGRTGTARAVRIPVPSDDTEAPPGAVLYLDYTPDAPPGWQGVRLQLAVPGEPSSRTLSAHPTRLPATTDVIDPDGWAAPTLAQGELWQLPGSDLVVGVDALDGSTATITVGYDGADLVPPVAARVTAPASHATTTPGEDLVWSAASDAGSGVEAYTVWVDDVPEATVGPDVQSIPVPVLAVGHHTARVDAVDRVGHLARGPEVDFSVAVNDVLAPSVVEDPWCAARRCSAVQLLVTADPRYASKVYVDGTFRVDVPASDGEQGVTAGWVTAAETDVTVRTFSDAGRPVSETTVVYPADVVAPTVPGRVRVRAYPQTPPPDVGLDVSWTGSEDDEALDGYSVSVPEDWTSGGYLKADGETGTTFLSAAVAPGHHCVEVRAVDVAGNSSAPAHGCYWVDRTPPAPGRLAARAVDAHHARLAWTAGHDPESGIAWYQVLRNGRAYGPRIAPAGRARWTRTVTVPAGRTRVGVRVADRAGLTTDLTTVVTTR